MESAFLLNSDPIMNPNSPTSRPRKHTSAQPKCPFVTRNGRKYHGDHSIPYPLPCDVKEMSRQALWHELSRELYGGHCCTDFKREKIPDRVLDLGCGSGIWCASMADYFAALGRPDVEFTGLDLEPMYMDMKGVNFKFVKHNILITPLPFEDNSFDFIFVRDMMMSLSEKSMYTGIIGEVMRLLKPGGRFELQCSMFPLSASGPYRSSHANSRKKTTTSSALSSVQTFHTLRRQVPTTSPAPFNSTPTAKTRLSNNGTSGYRRPSWLATSPRYRALLPAQA
jgi:SAM-dependent methyltransferase